MNIVIGVIKGNEEFLDKFLDQGFHLEDLDSHARALGEKLMGFKIKENDLARVRSAGIKISPRFWVNLAIMSAKRHDKILISGLSEEDCKSIFSKVI